MRKKLLVTAVFTLAVGLCVLAAAMTPGRPEQSGQTEALKQAPKHFRRPKLVIVLVIDQFRYDYLVRFRPYFVPGGFNLLLGGGANFTDCRYDYATTATCPGHATLFTGAYPDIHGIIENEWFDSASGKRIYCVSDLSVTQVGGAPGPGYSPRNLIGSTIGDELRLASEFKSKVIAISLKDRASVVPGGHTANAAYWYDIVTGHFATSTYYMQSLPEWVARFDAPPPAKAYCGKAWEALPETLEGGGSESSAAGGQVLGKFSPERGEPCPDGKFLAWLHSTPYMNEIELKFARQAIESERLGQGASTDLLSVSLSVNDYIGHAYGPYSPQVSDVTLRTDRYLADFFREVYSLVGLDNVWIVLSADHGVAPNPQLINEHGLGLGNFQPSTVEKAAERALSTAFGEGQWVQDVDETYLHLNPLTLKKYQVDRAKAQAVAAEAVSSVPGVMAAFTRGQIMSGALPRTPLARKVSNSFNSKRSGDLFLVLDQFAVSAGGKIETTHGTPWNYDAQVPLIFWGRAFNPGTYATPCQPIDLAPTLSAALGLTEPSGAQGRALVDALK